MYERPRKYVDRDTFESIVQAAPDPVVLSDGALYYVTVDGTEYVTPATVGSPR
jgi:hypothetical protein